MSITIKAQARSLLRTALNNPNADFRANQWEAIEALVEQQARLLVVQRTGWGKSLVYFLATRLLRERNKGLTLLISPLLALMRNQIAAARRIGVEAATINSNNVKHWQQVQTQLLDNQIDILLISPERLANEKFREEVLLPLSQKIGLFVVDEAHCISDWGHDFRPDYRRIVRILQALPSNLPVLATTATANNRVVADIQAQIGVNLQIIRGSLTRASLQLQNINLPQPATRLAWLADTLSNLPGSGIIYTLTVRDAQKLADWLISENIDARAYYGGLETEIREELENQLLSNEIKVLVATTALGMGFDKPDLSFVIHYQRPGSVVHYYQQVGRAGRAVDRAYGILLSGEEDTEITNYFIESAFPPQAHIENVLNVLRQAEDGLSIPQIEKRLNIARGQIEKVLKILALESPAPVVKRHSQWFATPVNYQINTQKIDNLIALRRQEQAQMTAYLNSSQCLMQFLATALDDSNPEPCQRCAICLNQPLLSPQYTSETVQRAIQFLRRSEQIIEPRKIWAKEAFKIYNFSGKIKPELQAESGRALSLWGDAGWGELVKRGKYEDEYFSDELVQAIVDLVRRWQPELQFSWVTCVPSLQRPNLVPNFAARLAHQLDLPFCLAVQKVRNNYPQKSRSNSYQQAHNLDGVFEINPAQIKSGSVLLVDDFVDSRWTFTVITALLRQGGCDRVFPLALALNSIS